MSDVSMSTAAFDANQRLATAGGFLLALGSMVADREACGGNESQTMKRTNAMVSHIECVIAFINNQQQEIERLAEANHRMEAAINEQKAKIEELKAKVREYYTAEQEIPGR